MLSTTIDHLRPSPLPLSLPLPPAFGNRRHYHPIIASHSHRPHCHPLVTTRC
ncbi:hypothetical protein KFK09_017117 [Dendrobium nobile]|uniref:Uncharacterized protein n=1 Tax=Dendrobium nobile TaxID=94219 RepID=A0A8T3B1F6_DENNO|nr:hypothetical protein KFK09_017117 [Dendrobium nobile]